MNASVRVVLPAEVPPTQRTELLRSLLDKGYAVDCVGAGDDAPAAALVPLCRATL